MRAAILFSLVLFLLVVVASSARQNNNGNGEVRRFKSKGTGQLNDTFVYLYLILYLQAKTHGQDLTKRGVRKRMYGGKVKRAREKARVRVKKEDPPDQVDVSVQEQLLTHVWQLQLKCKQLLEHLSTT